MELKLQSDEIDKISAAFISACSDIEDFKASKKGNYGLYVTINDIKHAAYKACLKYGLRYKQYRTIIDGKVIMITQLNHSSGQWERSYVELNLPANSKRGDFNQDWGASYSYQRRYELYGLFGILGEDIDPDDDPALKESTESSQSNAKVISKKQYDYIISLLANQTEREKGILEKYKIDDIGDLLASDCDEVINILKRKKLQ